MDKLYRWANHTGPITCRLGVHIPNLIMAEVSPFQVTARTIFPLGSTPFEVVQQKSGSNAAPEQQH